MGTCQSLQIDEKLEDAKVNREEEQIPHLKLPPVAHKILLLGPAGSGKTTIFEQIKVANNFVYSCGELTRKKYSIYKNVIQGIKALLELAQGMSIKLDDGLEKCQCRVVSHAPDVTQLNRELVEDIQKLWNSYSVQYAYKNRNLTLSTDNAGYFLTNLERISADSYSPTVNDILNTYMPTTDVISFKFTTENINFTVFDVGGLQSERKKWSDVLDDVNTLLFVVSVNDFDQKSPENPEENIIVSASLMFFHIVENAYFSSSSIIVFLNKTDLFRRKIEKIQISDHFPEFNTESPTHLRNTYDNGMFFFRSQFGNNSFENANQPFVHETCALTDGIGQMVIDSVLSAVQLENVRKVAESIIEEAK